MLGIAIITYNRLDALRECVARVKRFTESEYKLVIADDGSTDGTVEWTRSQDIRTITGINHGPAWNKNRALWYLLKTCNADPIILLEDDAWPGINGWDKQWIDATRLWGHINFTFAGWLHNGQIKEGNNTPDHPNATFPRLTGMVIASSREALNKVGFLDTRFKGYGFEHVEYTRRFGKAGYVSGQKFYSISGGIDDVGARYKSAYNAEQASRNASVYSRLLIDPSFYRDPWSNETEKTQFLAEINLAR